MKPKVSSLFLTMKVPLKDYLFVSIQFILFASYLLEIEFFSFHLPKFITFSTMIISCLGFVILVLALLQLKTNLSPFPSPKSNSELIQTGLYKFIRHPIYTGILVMLLGYGIYQTSSYKIGITFILSFLFYFKSKYEEQKLILKYPNYLEYRKRTGRFFPKLKI